MTSEQEQLLNPFPWYQSMRQNQPVYFNEENFSWSVFGYKDAQRVLSDSKLFSSQFMGGDGNAFASSMINSDPPRHRKLRSLATQAFTPRTVAQLAPRITELVHEMLDQVASKGEMDVIADLSYPLPIIVIAELLGVPVKDRERFKIWSDALVGTGDYSGQAAQKEMAEYFADQFEQRRSEPRDDLMTALLTAQIDGEHLSFDELLGFCILLLVAGNITTTNLIGNAFICFDEFPEALEQLYSDPSLLNSAIEEVLRYRSPVRCMFRVTTEDVVLGDQKIDQGRMVAAWISSANRDEAEFAQPDVFDVTRSPNHHIGFGHGIHYCLGAPLARLETKIALEIMLKRLPHMQRVRDIPLEPVTSLVLHGVNSFPITFQRS